MNCISITRAGHSCVECNRPIESGESVISLGLTWGRSSNGRVCIDCIVNYAQQIIKDGGVRT